MSNAFTVTRSFKASKQHRCVECGTLIKSGIDYVKVVGKVDGNFFHTKSHVDCKDAAEKLAYVLDSPDDIIGRNTLKNMLESCDKDNREWIRNSFPEVYARLGFEEVKPKSRSGFFGLFSKKQE